MIMLGTSLLGIKVLDFSQVLAGPACGMLLADMGADVVKIEAPRGELGRKLGPPWQNGESVVSMSCNRNKRALAIDLKKPGAADLMLRMARAADIVLESFRPGVMAGLGIGYEEVRAVRPEIVYCSISAYGQSGPWRDKPGVDGIVQAVSGLMSVIGDEGMPPCKVQVPATDMTTAFLATVAVLGALRSREREGVGQHLDVSLYNASLMLQQTALASYHSTGELPTKLASAAPYASPNEALPTRDGWIMVAAYHDDRWPALCRLLDRSELAADARFHDNASRVANRAELRNILGASFREKTTAAWLALLDAADILCGPIATYAEVVASPQYAHNNIAVEVDHPVAGKLTMPGFAIGDRYTQARVSRPPPIVGQHTTEVLHEYGLAAHEIEALLAQQIVAERGSD
jgi:crotonobetainyl-CoA:carnitine CoA-transferase CaiB-like acyl-CoA transferase